ncbi:MAG: NAD-dependent epimerase/dehydratase family protein [Candidatus Nanohalobium sp.]
MEIAVAGGTGFVGSNLLRSIGGSHRTVCIDRGKSEHADVSIEADIRDEEEYAAELESVDVAFYLIHSMSQDGDFSELEKECAEAFQRACEEHGVDRIIYLTGMIPEGELSDHLESRTRTGEILDSGDPDLTEIGSAIIMGEGSSSFRIMDQLVEKLPVMVTPKWLNSEVQPIHIDDVIFYLKEVMRNEETRNKYLEIGGADVSTYKEALEVLGEETGRKPFILTVPVLTPRLSSYWIKYVSDVNFSLVRALVDSIKHDMVVREDDISEYIAHDCMGYREMVREVISKNG